MALFNQFVSTSFVPLKVSIAIANHVKSDDEGDAESVKLGGLETIQGAGPPTSDSVSQGGTPDTDVIISKIRFYTSELHGLLDVLENKPD